MIALYDPADGKPGKYAIARGYKYRAMLLSRFPLQPLQVGVGDLFARQSRRLIQSSLVLLQLDHGQPQIGEVSGNNRSNDDVTHFSPHSLTRSCSKFSSELIPAPCSLPGAGFAGMTEHRASGSPWTCGFSTIRMR